MRYKRVKIIPKPFNGSEWATYPYVSIGSFLDNFSFVDLAKLIVKHNLSDFASENGDEYECMGRERGNDFNMYCGQYHTLYINFKKPQLSYYENTSDYYEA